MPSGNATFTYTGEEPSIEVGGETFAKGEATLTHDNGVIALLRDRDDFKETKAARGKAAEAEG